MLLTILVPTNTLNYTNEIIEKFEQWQTSNTQLVIAFNGDESEELFKEASKKYKLNNLLLVHSNTNNLISCLNDVLGLIDSDYVTFIGNDDMFMYEIEKLALYAKNNNIDAIKYNLNIVYFWPFTKNKDSLTIMLKRHTRNRFFRLQKENTLHKLYMNAGQDYISLPLVNFYHGLIKTELLHKAKSISGFYSAGTSPDIYYATSLTLMADKLIVLNVPFSIPGIGNKSASNEALKNEHQSRIDESRVKHLNDMEVWPLEKAPFFNSQSTWAVSMLIALKNFGKNDLSFEKFNWKLLNLYQFIYNSTFRENYKFITLVKSLSIFEIRMLSKHLINKILTRLKSGFFNRIHFSKLEISELEKIYVNRFKYDYKRAYTFINDVKKNEL